MASQNENEFFPRALKLVSISCLIVLGLAAIVVYNISPKLALGTRFQPTVETTPEEPIIDLEQISSIEEELLDSPQSSPTSFLLPTSSPVAVTPKTSQPSVQSIVDSQPSSTTPTSSPTAQPTQAQSSKGKVEPTESTKSTKCSPERNRESLIMGIIVDGRRIFLTPKHQLYKLLYQKLDHKSQVRWFCSKEQAIQAGWKEARSSDYQYFTR